MTPRILKSGKHDDSFYAELWHSLFEREQWQGEIWNKRKDGELYPLWLMINAVKDEHGQVVMYSAMARDLSDRLKYEEKIKYQAYYDGLTDLPNRRFFYQKAHDCLLLAKRYNYLMAIMFIDLDAFKIINDNSWVQLRKSNTEPIIRIIAEAESIEEVNELIKSIADIVNV